MLEFLLDGCDVGINGLIEQAGLGRIELLTATAELAKRLIRPCSESPKNKQDKALPADSISEVMALFVQNESNKAYLHR